MALNLEKQLLFYGQYHHESTNVAIHIVCVPTIFFTGLFLGARSPSLPVPTTFQVPWLPPNACTLFAFVYASLYVLMEPVAGGLLGPLILGVAAISNYLTAALPSTPPAPLSAAWSAPSTLISSVHSNGLLASLQSARIDLQTLTYIAVALNVSSWLAQFVGHKHFERRAPALRDNLVQAVFLAPFFVWFEILFMLGYRPGLRARLDGAVKKEIHKYRAGQERKVKESNGKAQ